jgi:hypothetical protein
VGTTDKTISALALTAIGGNLGTDSGTTGVVDGAVVTIAPQPIPIPTTLGVPITLTTPEVVTVGTLTFDLTTEELEDLVAQTTSINGDLALGFFGSFSDSSGTFSTATASMGETCTQSAGAATNLISCSESLSVPGVPLPSVPEPTSMVVLGSALLGLGLLGRRKLS